MCWVEPRSRRSSLSSTWLVYMVVRFADPPGAIGDPDATHLDAHLLLRPGLPYPDLSDVGDDPSRPVAGGRGRRAGPAGAGAAAGGHRTRARGADLGAHALRKPPAIGAPGRVQARNRAQPQ